MEKDSKKNDILKKDLEEMQKESKDNLTELESLIPKLAENRMLRMFAIASFIIFFVTQISMINNGFSNISINILNILGIILSLWYFLQKNHKVYLLEGRIDTLLSRAKSEKANLEMQLRFKDTKKE